MFLDKKGFCKEGFVLKIVLNMDRKSKDKASEGQRVWNII
jgi:hypothetical protein